MVFGMSPWNFREAVFLYRFVVDKAPTLDPASRGTFHDAHYGEFSTREIGH